MKLLYLSLALGAAIAGAVAWRLGGPEGNGVLLGAWSALALGGVAITWQRRLLATRPAGAMTAFALAFLAKLVFVMAGAITLRYGEFSFADWTTFLLAFPIAVLWTTCTGWIGARPVGAVVVPRTGAVTGEVTGS